MNGQAMYAEVQRQGGDDFLKEHAPLVKRIAYHLAARLPDCVQVDDLIQAGMVGLLEASENFDPTQGASFKTYAGIRIRGAMLDEVRGSDWAPRSVRKRVRSLTEATKRVEERTGGVAEDAAVAAEMGVSIDEYHRALREATSTRIFSLDDDDVSQQAENTCTASAELEPETMFGKSAFKAALARAIGELPEREQIVMSLYYDHEMTLREIGEVLGVVESRVCQIHGQALIRLRSRLGDWLE